MSKRSRSKANIPIHRESVFSLLFSLSCFLSPVFCLPSSAFCLLSSVFCLLSSASCLLSPAFCLLSSVFYLNRPSCPACHEFMGQLCKTNPIFLRPKPMQPSLPQRFMRKNHPWEIRKNKPNQTQSPCRIPQGVVGDAYVPAFCPNFQAAGIVPGADRGHRLGLPAL